MKTVSVFRHGSVTAGEELLSCVFADGFQHGEPRLHVGASRPLHETLIHQPRQRAKNIGSLRVRDRLGCLDRPASGKGPKPGKKRLLLRCEEIVAPGDGGADSLLPCRSITRAAAELQQACRQPLQELGRGKESRPRGGELDGKWETVETAADQSDDCAIRFV